MSLESVTSVSVWKREVWEVAMRVTESLGPPTPDFVCADVACFALVFPLRVEDIAELVMEVYARHRGQTDHADAHAGAVRLIDPILHGLTCVL